MVALWGSGKTARGKQGGRIDPLPHGAPQGTQEGTQRCFVPCLGHQSPEEGERGQRGARVPSAGLERLLSRGLVQSEKEVSTAQLSQSTKKKKKKEKKKKTERGAGPGPTNSRRAFDYRSIYSESSADGGNTREGKTKKSPSVQASVGKGTALCGAGRLWDRRRSEHQGARAPRPGGNGAARRGAPGERAPRASGRRARKGLGGDARLAGWRGVPKNHAQRGAGSRTRWMEQPRGYLSPKGVRGEGAQGLRSPWSGGGTVGMRSPAGGRGSSSPGASSGMCKHRA